MAVKAVRKVKTSMFMLMRVIVNRYHGNIPNWQSRETRFPLLGVFDLALA